MDRKPCSPAMIRKVSWMRADMKLYLVLTQQFFASAPYFQQAVEFHAASRNNSMGAISNNPYFPPCPTVPWQYMPSWGQTVCPKTNLQLYHWLSPIGRHGRN